MGFEEQGMPFPLTVSKEVDHMIITVKSTSEAGSLGVKEAGRPPAH